MRRIPYFTRKSKLHIGVAIVLVGILGLFFCFDGDISFSVGEVDKLYIQSGLTGDNVIVTDSEVIQRMTENINSLSFKKTWGDDRKKGYSYILKWFDADDTQVAIITVLDLDGCQINCDGHFYKVSNGQQIDVELINEILKEGGDEK